MSKTYTGGLNGPWPTKGDTNWDTNVDTYLTTISGHAHTGSGDGVQLSTNSFAANSVTGAKILLANNESLNARNASAISTGILKLNASNQVEVGATGVPVRVFGTATNDAASAGQVGEILGPVSRALGSAIALTTATTANVATTTSITLTPGDWELRGAVGFTFGATTNLTKLIAGVSLTTATLPATSTTALPTSGEVRYELAQAAAVPGANVITIQIPSYRVSVASNTTLFLVAQATFTVSTASAFGYMEARRAR